MDIQIKQFFWKVGEAKNPFGKLRQRWLQVYEYREKGPMDSEHHLNCLWDFSWQKCHYKNGMTMDIETERIVRDSADLKTELG